MVFFLDKYTMYICLLILKYKINLKVILIWSMSFMKDLVLLSMFPLEIQLVIHKWLQRKKNIIYLKAYNSISYNSEEENKNMLNKYQYRENTYYNDDILITMWGTDLLPYEIKQNINKLEEINNNIQNVSNFVGMTFEVCWDF